MNPQQRNRRLKELAQVFLRLGAIAFGGPAAHIAMMDDEVVKRRQWMSREKLLDLIGITNLLPGPNSTELPIHMGFERAGWVGLLVAGSCFILPAMILVWLLAIVYVRYQTVPQVEWLLYGIKPVIIAVVLQALWKLGQKAAKDTPTIIAGIMAIAGYFARFNEIFLLLSLGIVVMLIKSWQNSDRQNQGLYLLPFSGMLAQGGASTVVSLGWGSVFWFFLKIGSILYGSGYPAFLTKKAIANPRCFIASGFYPVDRLGLKMTVCC